MTPGFLLLRPNGEENEFSRNCAARIDALGFARFPIGSATLHVEDDMPVLFGAHGLCAVLGTLFRRDEDRAVHTLSAGETYAISASAGALLIDRFWGGYVAITVGLADTGVFVIRDPSAQQAIYHWRLDGFELLFSNFETALKVIDHWPVCDWTAVAHHLRYPQLRIAATGIVGVSEMLPGQRLCLETGILDQLWSPWTFVPTPTPHDRLGARERVRATVDRCVRTWAMQYPGVQLELSGGLDSSIIAACIGDGPSTWVTYAAPGASGDERRYARAVSDCLGHDLEELRIERLEWPAALSAPRVRPGNVTVFEALDRALDDAALRSGATAILSGAGGDNVFCSIQTAGPVVDALLSAGLMASCRAVRDVAALGETDFWNVLRHAWRQWRRSRIKPWGWIDDQLFLGDAGKVPFAGHPWLDAPDHALPGKQAHVAALVRILPHLDAHRRARRLPMISPLMAQPLLELCLGIPTFAWIAGGRDRAVARHAFASRLPSLVIERRAKGGLHSLLVPAYEDNRETLRALIMNGRLAAQAIIDTEAVSEALAKPASAHNLDYIRILDIADLERWVQAIEGLGRG